MIELNLMSFQVRTILISAVFILFSLVLATMVFGGGTGQTQLTNQDVDETLATLLEDGYYEYDEADFEDPEWLLWLKEKIANFWSRWEGSPISSVVSGDFRIAGMVLAVVLVAGIFWLVLAWLMGWQIGRRGMVKTEGLVGDLFGVEGWGEVGIEKAIEYAGQGRFREAVSVLFRAVLKGLDNSGWIRYRKSGPSRYYLRQLRRSEEIYPLFRDLLGRFEVAYYRKINPDEDDWTFMYEKYGSLVRVVGSTRTPEYMRQDF